MLRTLQFFLEFRHKCQKNNNKVNIYIDIYIYIYIYIYLKNIIYLENLNIHTYISYIKFKYIYNKAYRKLYKFYLRHLFKFSYILLFWRQLFTHMSMDYVYMEALIINSQKCCNITLLHLNWIRKKIIFNLIKKIFEN